MSSMCHSASTSKSHSAFDFEGLEESLVDNNEEDDDNDDFIEPGGMLDTSIPMGVADSSGVIFDHNLIMIRDALIRDSLTRTEEDFEIIVRFLSIINSNHDHMTRRRLAPHFVLAEIEARDTRVLTHGEKLDAYCIVAAGSLRHVLPCEEDALNQEAVGSSVDDDSHSSSGEKTLRSSSCPSSHHHHHQNVRYLQVGDEFGAHLDDRVVYGEIFTNDNFVWVLCVPHVIFDQICGEKTFKTIRDEVTGNIIEMRANSYIPISPGSMHTASVSGPPPPDETTGDEFPIVQPPVANGYVGDNFSSHSQAEIHTQLQQLGAPNKTSASPPGTVPVHTGTVASVVPPLVNKQISLVSNDSNELIRATKERLYELVFAQKSSETFIEDFLLTFRIWSEKELKASRDVVIMRDLMHRLCSLIRSNQYVENCVRIVLIWMANHFQDFQNDNRFLLEDFENILKERSLTDHLRLFHLNLSAKSSERSVTVKRSDRNTTLPFSLIGGYECSARLFIGEVFNVQMVPSSATSSSSLNNSSTSLSTNNSTGQGSNSQNMLTLGLRSGDRVLSINGVDCHVMPLKKAYDLCLATTHLSLLVKYDPHLYNALIQGRCETKRQFVETYSRNNRSSTGSAFPSGSGQMFSQSSAGITPNKDPPKKDGQSTGNMWRQKVRSLVSMTTKELISSTSNILSNNSHHSGNGSISGDKSSSGQQVLNNGQILMPGSISSSSLSSNSIGMGSASNGSVPTGAGSTHPRVCSYEVPEIIKIFYYENNDSRFLPITSATTARECIQLSLIEFNLSSAYSSKDFALSKYSVVLGTNNANGATEPENPVAERTQRVGDGSSDLVTQLGLNARFYLKLVNPSKESSSNSNSSSEGEKDKEIFKEIVKESSIVSLLNLDGIAIARELTARDFRLFCKIEAQQFVYDLAFNDPNRSSSSSGSNSQDSGIVFDRTKELQEFEKRTNEEMFWTINQVLSEKRSNKRVKVIRELINIANIAMKLNNFNTLFAILSGLTHLSVSRLKSCWDKIPNKIIKELEKLQMLMDPSRNFYNFRQKLMEILRQDNGAYIIIPFFPLVKKDLSFIWLANQTYINSAENKQQTSDNGAKPKGEMLVNWEKMRLLSEKIREIQKMTNTTSLALAAVDELNQSTGVNIATPSAANEPIDPNLLFRIFADKMTGGTSGDPKEILPKKLWENQIMNKRVQAFLDESFVSVQSDEQKLLVRSYSCEIPHTPNPSVATRNSIASTMSSNSQLSHPSPTPSTASSSSNSLSMNSDGPAGHLLHRPHRPRFGQTSPKQLRKLLALSDGAVAVHREHARNENIANMHSTHLRNGHAGSHSHHHHPHLSSNASNSSNPSQNHSHNSSQPSQHQYSHQPQHSFHSSNSSLNSSLSGSTSYYNNLYGCHPNSQSVNPSTTTTSSSVSHYHVSNINGSMTLPSSYIPSGAPHMGMSKLSRNYSQSNAPFNPGHFSDLCCPPAGNNNQCCNSGPQNGVLYPGQSYCSCCPQPPATPTMRAPMMIMPPPQQSGLMHPSCPCGPSSQTGRGQRHVSCQGAGGHSQGGTHTLKQPLPVESSSVTSLRRLEQYQQSTITRYQNHREVRTLMSSKSSSSRALRATQERPQCPDYDTAMQRLCTGNSTITINGNALNHNGSNKGSLMRPNPVPPIPPPPPTTRSHHREDIV